MALIDVQDAKGQLNEVGSSDDGELQLYVDSAIAVIERYTGDLTSSQTFTMTATFSPSPTWVPNRPVTAILSAVDSGGNTLDVSAWTFTSDTITADSNVSATVTYQAGFLSPPANYKLAALIIVQHLWETQRGSMPGTYPTLDDQLSGQVSGGAVSGFAIPNRALELLGGPYVLGFA